VVEPKRQGIREIRSKKYLDHIAEYVEGWTYVKFPYLKKKISWKGFVDGSKSGA